MINISALAKPIFDLLASFGSGVLPTGGPSDSLRGTSTALDLIHQMGRDSINGINAAWDGRAADAATAKALRVQTSAATISDRGNDMATVVNDAAAQVESGQKELTGIAQSFVDTAAAAGPALATPQGLALIVGSAIDHLGQAVNVVGRVRNELDTHTASMNELTPPPPTPAPAGLPAAAAGAPQLVSSATGVLGGVGSVMSGLLSSPISQVSKAASTSPSTSGTPKSDPGKTASGTGVKITLPDGSTVEAPNERAATAVRSALGTVGTPYVWGGNTPGAGLDCSGMTKYAYGEAGVDLPRLACDQGNGGTQVSAGDVMPGDLAIWDGHVAMVIGNGQFVEAGDPVQISSIRTENSGMDFYGFYRPTS